MARPLTVTLGIGFLLALKSASQPAQQPALATGEAGATRTLTTQPVAPAVAIRAAPKPSHVGRELLTAFLGKPPDTASHVNLDVILVSLPDPVSSHLDWSYDAQLESVRRAFERHGDLIDRYRLPWRQRGDSSSNRITISDSLPGAQVPGVLLFRGSDSTGTVLHLVYLVGEVPTFGVHKNAMLAALDERQELLSATGFRKGDVIRIVGPAFSGSSLSMRQVIDHWRDSSGRKTPVVIVTGSASDESNLKTLTGDGITFSATVHTSSRLTTAAESLLTRRMDFDSSEIAILREGTTQYGRGQSAPDTGRHTAARIGPLRVSFPMNISSLRAQYARHPQVQPATEGQTTPAGPRIPLDSREPATLTESPEVLSQLTPPAVEILFTQLERTLVAHHIRAVGILATDIRDQLFIADELRKRLRDVQLVFYGSNALLLRSEYSKSLIGSIVVSTYPLFLENQYWDLTKPEDDHERFVFMSDESQGVFNATLRQLGADDAMVEYAPPVTHSGQALSQPPVWFTVVGNDAFYPISLASDKGSLPAIDRTYVSSRTSVSRRDATERVRRPFQFLFALAVLCILFVISFSLVQQRTASRVNASVLLPEDAEQELDASREFTPREQEDNFRAAQWASLLLHRELYVSLRYVALFGTFSAILLLLLRPRAHGVAGPAWSLITIGVFAFMLTAIIAKRAISQTLQVLRLGQYHRIGFFQRGRSPRRDYWLWMIELAARCLVLAIGLVYFLVLLVFIYEVLTLDPLNSAMFFHRAVALMSGVSPAIPIILSSLGFATWCSWHLVRIELLSKPTVYEEFLLRRAAGEVWLREARKRVQTIQAAVDKLSHRAIQRAADALRLARLARKALTLRTAGAGSNTQEEQRKARECLGFAEASAFKIDMLVGEAESTVERALADGTVPVGAQRENIKNAQTRDIRRARDVVQSALSRAKARCEEMDPSFAEPSRAADAAPRRNHVLAWFAARYHTFENWYDGRRRDEWLEHRSVTAAQQVHDALLYLIPSFGAVALFGALSAIGVWLCWQFELTIESALLNDHLWLMDITSFDVLFRFGILSTLGATVWAIYRFGKVWSGIQTILGEIDPVLHGAFSALPERLARVTRLTPFGQTSRGEIEAVVEERWKALRGITSTTLGLAGGLEAAPMPRALPYEANSLSYTVFDELHNKIQECRARDLFDCSPERVLQAAGNEELLADRKWAKSASELYVVYVADYIDWVFQHLRYLASFLIVAMVLTVVLLASYPFQPQSVLKVISTILMAAAVMLLLVTVVQMNRDSVLSAITRTPPGKVSWDGSLVGSLVTYGIVPVLTAVSTAFPQVREFLFSWFMPLLRALVKT